MRGKSLAILLLTLAAPVVASDLVLQLPIDCELQKTCHIQHLVDRDPGQKVSDFRCGGLSYDGHKGTDFALPSFEAMRRGVDVLAAAPGVVTALRDGMPDAIFSSNTAGEIAGRECGNGVVIRHDGGWETQYCHLQKGSVAVSKGDQVVAGMALGKVGLRG